MSRRTRRPTRRPAVSHGSRGSSALDPELLRDIDEAAAHPHPVRMLLYASTLAQASRPDDHPMAAHTRPPRTLSAFVRTLLGVHRRSTDTLALALDPYLDQAEERIDVGALGPRGALQPAWAMRLYDIRPVRAAVTTQPFGDSENVLVDIHLPGGAGLALVAFIDHDAGTLLSDAFLTGRSLDQLLGDMADSEEDAHLTTAEIPLADARARIEQAMQLTVMTYPPIETDSWPAIRPFAEWMLGRMPEGGTGHTRPDLSEAQRDAIVKRFTASAHAGRLAGTVPAADVRDAAESILWFGCDYSTGDPWRWSPVAVEVFLIDWVPRKIIDDADHLLCYPAVLRAFIRFAHAESSIPADLTRRTLAALGDLEAEYREAIVAPHRTGPEALLERAGILPAFEDDEPDADDPYAPPRWMPGQETDDFLREMLVQEVGGSRALGSLDDAPLPHENLDAEAVPAGLRGRADELAAQIDRAAAGFFDDEVRTVALRILARAAAADDHALTRGTAENAAAAILWIAGRINDAFDDGLTVQRMVERLGLKSSPSQRAHTILAALGVRRPADWSVHPVLCDAALLTSVRRAHIVSLRDALGET